VTYGFQRRYHQAAIRFRQARTLFAELGDQAGEAGALGNLGLVCRWQGRYRQALEHLERSLALARRIGHPYVEGTALYNLGMTCYWLSRYPEAIDYQEQALALARWAGARTTEANALQALGLIAHQRGTYQDALTYHEQALTIFRDLGGDQLAEAGALNSLADTLLATGQTSRAHACHTTALAVARQLGEPSIQATALEGLGRISYHHGDYPQANAHHQQALALYQGELTGSSRQPGALNSAGETLLALGQLSQARTCHTSALTLSRRSGDRYQHARALYGLAAICQAAGEPAQARRHQQRAHDIYTSLDVPGTRDHLATRQLSDAARPPLQPEK
jgi:tetratricopeptide (TPR) repeat protein